MCSMDGCNASSLEWKTGGDVTTFSFPFRVSGIAVLCNLHLTSDKAIWVFSHLDGVSIYLRRISGGNPGTHVGLDSVEDQNEASGNDLAGQHITRFGFG